MGPLPERVSRMDSISSPTIVKTSQFVTERLLILRCVCLGQGYMSPYILGRKCLVVKPSGLVVSTTNDSTCLAKTPRQGDPLPQMDVTLQVDGVPQGNVVPDVKTMPHTMPWANIGPIRVDDSAAIMSIADGKLLKGITIILSDEEFDYWITE